MGNQQIREKKDVFGDFDHIYMMLEYDYVERLGIQRTFIGKGVICFSYLEEYQTGGYI